MNLNRHRGKVFSIQLDVCIFRTITRSIIYMKICRKNSDEKGQPEERLNFTFGSSYNIPTFFSRNLHKIMLNTRHPYMVNDKVFRMHV